ncbi:MAG TPA: hypothetical protein VNI57_12340, partial [Candidatus Saccharimonadales bacterium]|nr:hypothetical protein [Candidatus Saccharimonadales bacterium]
VRVVGDVRALVDGDGLGDACDKCPNVSDNANAWHPGYPELGIDPYPIQQDSDNDGIPDACDGSGWGSAGATADGAFYQAGNALRANGAQRHIEVTGPAGSLLHLPFMACDNGDPEGPGTNERVEAVFEGLPASIEGWVENGSGEVRARIRPHETDPSLRGMRFRPRCNEDYFLVLRTEASFPGFAAFDVTVDAHTVPQDNPWSSNAALFADPPPAIPDMDDDGVPDAVDTCPAVYDPGNADADGDGTGDACDATPGGPVTLVFSGVVASFDDGAGAPDFPGIAPGVPFMGRLTYDTTMPLETDDYPVSRSWLQPSPIEPLELSVIVAGHRFSAGPGDGLGILVENDNSSGEDRFVVTSGDVAEQSAMSESLAMTLVDPTATVFPRAALPPFIDPSDFSQRTMDIVLDSGAPETSSHMSLVITSLSESYKPPRLYWLDTSTQKINRSDADGSNIVTLVNANSPIAFEVDPEGNRIYWTECCLGKVRSSALDGSGAVDLVTGLGFPFGIGLDAPSATLFFAQISSPLRIYSSGIGGGLAVPFQDTSPNTPYGVAVDPGAGKVYWTEGIAVPAIRRSNVDGSGVETLIDGSVVPLANAQGIALDPSGGKMYWTDLGYDRIYRSNLDGTGPELLEDFVSAGLQNPTGIAVDSLHGKLYWADTTLHQIQRANLDGSMLESVLTVADGLSYPRDLFVDPGTNCQPPTEALSIVDVDLAGGINPMLVLSDSNATSQVTGYDVYRASDASLARSSWPLIALDAPDGDPLTPEIEWTDTAAGPPPGAVWYYVVAAYNAACPLEGPQ